MNDKVLVWRTSTIVRAPAWRTETKDKALARRASVSLRAPARRTQDEWQSACRAYTE